MKVSDRVGNVPLFFGQRVLIFGDNLAVFLAFSRRRAKHFKLLVQTRRMSAVSLAKNVRFYFRWVASEMNHADEDSRIFLCSPALIVLIPSCSLMILHEGAAKAVETFHFLRITVKTLAILAQALFLQAN